MGEGKNYTKLEEELEIKSLRRIISAYLNYSDAAEQDVRKYERSYKKLSPAHKALLSYLPEKYRDLRRCISMNSYFIMSMLQAFEPPIVISQDIDIDIDIDQHEYLDESCNGFQTKDEQNSQMNSFSMAQPISRNGCRDSGPENDIYNEDMHIGNSCCVPSSEDIKSACHNNISNGSINAKTTLPPCDWLDPSFQLDVPLVDVDKVRCIIRNIVRDWATEGREERDRCYRPILEELNRLFPQRSKEEPPCCLVPGAGLGRLALEISSLGFVTQGNEFSYYMMICSSFILNHSQIADEWTICPWIHNNCNSLSGSDQLRSVTFPDIHPASAEITEGFSMCGGDFIEVYGDGCQEASWDAVVTCFFLDTAHNIVEYIEIISKIIKDGGVWINLGPLLYHFADAYGPDEMSIELSLEDVKKIAIQYDFELEMEKTIETTYTANPRSMMQNRYYAAFWTMKRKART